MQTVESPPETSRPTITNQIIYIKVWARNQPFCTKRVSHDRESGPMYTVYVINLGGLLTDPPPPAGKVVIYGRSLPSFVDLLKFYGLDLIDVLQVRLLVFAPEPEHFEVLDTDRDTPGTLCRPSCR